MSEDDLLDYVRDAIIIREKKGLPTSAGAIIERMLDELPDVPKEAIIKAVKKFLVP